MIRLRKTVLSDLQIVSSWIENKADCRSWGGNYMRFPHTVKELAEDIQFPEEKTYSLVDEKDGVIGMGQLLNRNSRLHLARIIIAPSYRGQGFGRILCEELIKEGINVFGATLFSLNVFKFNTPALNLYQNMGFTAVTAPRDSFAGNDCIYMILKTEKN